MSLNVPTYTGNTWVDNSEPDLSAENLNKIETGVTNAVEGVNKIAGAVTNQFENEPEKIASAALAYQLNSNLMFKGNTTDLDALINDTSYTDKVICNTYHYDIVDNPTSSQAGFVFTHYISADYVTQRVFDRGTGTDYSRRRSNSTVTNWINPVEQLNSDLGAKALVLNAIPYAPGGTTYYAVKNGVCYVDTQSLNLTATGSGVIIANGLPSPAIATHTSLSAVDGSEIVGLAYVDVGTTMLRANINKIASNVWVSFSYPITS